MAKSDARFGYQAQLSREDHNLSQSYGFTTAPGMLLPIWYDFATPGDSYYMEHKLPLLRSSQLAAPAMIDVKVHYETFFVPIQLIYQPAENTLTSIKEAYSSLIDTSLLANNNFPLLPYGNIVSNIVTNHQTDDYHADAFRLCDLFGLCPDTLVNPVSNFANYMPNFFPWQLAAYHTIFQYYFRLDDKSSFDNAFSNLDQFYTGGTTTSSENWFVIHQRPWDFDYFTSMYRSPIVSSSSMQTVLSGGNYSDLVPGGYNMPMQSNGGVTTQNDLIRSFTNGANGTYSSTNINQIASAALIRQAFANEKLAMITGRTRKNYDSQVLAHYGVTVPHDVKHDITMIHHDEFDLNVQEVTNLAQSSSAALGELAGKSYSSGKGETFKFQAPCHGVVMTIFSVEPKRRYHSNFDRINSVTTAFDLPIPEFDRLGNVPMYRYECGYFNQGSGDNRSNNDIIGWKERYYQFKRKFDKVSYAFTIKSSVNNNYAPYFLSCRPFAYYGSNADPRPDMESRFYIDRGAMDGVCLIPFVFGWLDNSSGENWNNTPWLVYARDPFIVNSHIEAKKVSWMSKDGEPVYTF